ncbi:MAG TPA: Ig-like domain-containing protein [Gemmatimonadaceae bacterium]|nr:Ig-like domain-containing protein [Gemmatimonadaceae bacterium]
MSHRTLLRGDGNRGTCLPAFAGMMMLLAACHDSLTGVDQSLGVYAPVAQVNLIDGEAPILVLGAVRHLSATASDSKGGRLYGRRVTWTTSNDRIASVFIRDNEASVFALSAGTVTITATVEGVSASRTFTVSARPEATGQLRIESFSVIEVGEQGGWLYAPLVRITAPATSAGGEVTGLDLVIPELAVAISCDAVRGVRPGESIDLFREIYGDFEISFSAAGVRAATAGALVVVRVRENGVAAELMGSTSVRPGAYPSTYTGGYVSAPWNCHWA